MHSILKNLKPSAIGLLALSALVAVGCGRNSNGGDRRYDDQVYNQGRPGYPGPPGGGGVRGGGGGGFGGGGFGGGPQGGGPGGHGGYGGGSCSIDNLDAYFDSCQVYVEETRRGLKRGFHRTAGQNHRIYPDIFSDRRFISHHRVEERTLQCLQNLMCVDSQGPQGGVPPQGNGFPRVPRGGLQQGPPQGPQQGPSQDGYQPYEPEEADVPYDTSESDDYGNDSEARVPSQRADRPRRGR